MSNQYYEVADFDDLKPVIKHPIKDFVSNLNYLVDDETILQTCDFYVVMLQVHKINSSLVDILNEYMGPTENNTYGVYLYLKFLLLEPEEQIFIVNRFFDKLKFVSKNIEQPIEEVLRIMFDFVEDEHLNEFLNTKDLYLNYRPLNTSKIENIINSNINYFTKDFIDLFILNIRQILRYKFIVKFIYFISDCTKTQVLEEGETSISPFEDFQRRFFKNLYSHMFIFNYFHIVPQIYNKVDTVENLRKYYFKEIPNDRYLYYSNPVLDKAQIKVYIKKLFYKIITPNDDNMEYCLNSFIERNPKDLLRNLLLVEYKYDINVDNYRLAPVASLNKSISDILLKRFKKCRMSKLFKSLKIIDDVKKSLVISQKDQQVIEFDKYLDKVLKSYHYDSTFFLHYLTRPRCY